MAFDPLTAAFETGIKLIDKFVPDAGEKANQLYKLKELKQRGDLAEINLMLAQIDVNKESAKSGSFFVAGARPSIIWVCGLAFAIQYVVYPLLALVIETPPQIDMSVMMPVLLGLLGLGGCRSFDKLKGIDTKKM